MKTLRRLSAALSLCLLAAGCAPSVHQLLVDRHFNEVVCAVGAPGNPTPDEHPTARELTRQLGVAMHLHPVSKRELEGLLGDKAAPIHDKLVLVRVRWQSNKAALDEVGLDVSMSTPTTNFLNLAGDREKLASIAGEKLPDPTTEHYGPDALTRAADAAHDTLAVGAAILAPLTLGVSTAILGEPHMSPDRPEGDLQVGPSHEQYMKVAPTTEAMYVTMPNAMYCRGETGRICDGFLVLRRPDDQRAPVKLLVIASYNAVAGTLETCSALDDVSLALPAGATLEERITALFGTKMRRLDELRTRQ